MTIKVPELALVVLMGTTGSGKSTFAARHFLPTEVVSSDACRAMVADDPNDQSVTPAAFELVHLIAAKRLEAGRLAVIDATNVEAASRRPLVALARSHHVLPVAIVLDVPEGVCATRNAGRPDRAFGPHVLRNQARSLRRSFRGLRKEGFQHTWFLHGVDEVDGTTIERTRLWTDHRDAHGPFDLVGDIHGCHAELVNLLDRLGYQVSADGTDAVHPQGRQAFFVGDLVDRGPATPAVLRLVMGMVDAGHARCVPGNHEAKLLRALRSAQVTTGHGLDRSLEQLAAEPPGFRERVEQFIDGLVSHQVVDDGRLVVAHAGLPQAMQGRASGAVRAFSLYGDTTGETDEFGLPVRYPWAEDYRGDAMVVYGHTPVPEPQWVNHTICIDTGCVFGGRLTALRYPERELVSVAAEAVHWEPTRPLVAEVPTRVDPLELDLADVAGKRIVATGLLPTVTIREEHSIAALEVMSRFAADPRWLVYLPPTMSPPATSSRPDVLEHPEEVWHAFRSDGVRHLVCEEKHMGSRAVAIVCRTPEAARRRFGISRGSGPADGCVVTRTGRPFLADPADEGALLERLAAGVEGAGLWAELATDWLVLDAELLPWSAKAGELLRAQYAAVGAAATTTLAAEVDVVEAVAARTEGAAGLRERVEARRSDATGFVDAYRRYCWPVTGVDDVVLAPFQVLAAEGEVLARRPHRWHLDVADRLAATGPVFRTTRSVDVDLEDPESTASAERWWAELTAAGGEGMVVKSADGIVIGPRGPVQPGIKCRGREYLRIIYGPEYTADGQLDRLRRRSVGRKRSLAMRELALGLEALDRFVAGQPLHRVHECVFGVLALESEPVDPRL